MIGEKISPAAVLQGRVSPRGARTALMKEEGR